MWKLSAIRAREPSAWPRDIEKGNEEGEGGLTDDEFDEEKENVEH